MNLVHSYNFNYLSLKSILKKILIIKFPTSPVIMHSATFPPSNMQFYSFFVHTKTPKFFNNIKILFHEQFFFIIIIIVFLKPRCIKMLLNFCGLFAHIFLLVAMHIYVNSFRNSQEKESERFISIQPEIHFE